MTPPDIEQVDPVRRPDLTVGEIEALRCALVHALADRDFAASRSNSLHLAADEKLRVALTGGDQGVERQIGDVLSDQANALALEGQDYERVEAERDKALALCKGLLERCGDFANSVERDRREPDKLLCHLQSVRRFLTAHIEAGKKALGGER